MGHPAKKQLYCLKMLVLSKILKLPVVHYMRLSAFMSADIAIVLLAIANSFHQRSTTAAMVTDVFFFVCTVVMLCLY